MSGITRSSGITQSPKRIRAFLGTLLVAAAAIAITILIALGMFSTPKLSADNDIGTKVESITLAADGATPLEVEFKIIDELIVGMRAGDKSMLGVEISNPTSQAYGAVINVKASIANSPDVSAPVRITTYWEDGTPFRSGETILIEPSLMKRLTIEIFTLDGAGSAEIQISVARLLSEFI